MSLKLLKVNNPESFKGSNYLDEDFYQVGDIVETVYDDKNVLGSSSLEAPCGNSVKIEFDYMTEPNVYRVKEFRFRANVVNSGANNVIFPHPIDILEKMTTKMNRQIVEDYNRLQLRAMFNDALNNSKTDRERDLLFFKVFGLAPGTRTLTIPAGTTVAVNIDLMPFLPTIIQNHVFGANGTVGKFTSIEIGLYFSGEAKNPVNCEYVASSDTNSSWNNANISFTDMKLDRVLEYTKDLSLLVQNVIALTDMFYFEEIQLNMWDVVGNKFIFKPSSNNYKQFDNVLDFRFVLYDKASNTAYNSATAGMYFSGPDYIGYKIQRGKAYIQELNGANKLYERQKQVVDFYKRRHNVHVSADLLATTNNDFNRKYQYTSVIDVSNVESDDQSDYTISRFSTTDSTYQIELYVEKLLPSASKDVVLYVLYHYYKMI